MFISIRNINKIFKTIFRPIGNGRKWTIFIVHSIALGSQQASYLKSHLPWNVGEFNGEMKITLNSQKQWDEILKKYQVSTRII